MYRGRSSFRLNVASGFLEPAEQRRWLLFGVQILNADWHLEIFVLPSEEPDTAPRVRQRFIAAVEIGIIRPLERHTARKLFNEEGIADFMMALNGVSRMWLFSLYEFWRTWRQRASYILQVADQYAKSNAAKQKAFLEKTIAEAEGKEKHVFSAASFYSLEHGGRSDRFRRLRLTHFGRMPRNSFGPLISLRFRVARSSPVAVLSVT